MLSIVPSLLISMSQANEILTQKDWVAASRQSAVPVRVTLQGDSKLVGIKRLSGRSIAYGDVGQNPSFDDEQVTFDALLMFGNKKAQGAFAPSIGQFKSTYTYLALLPMNQRFSNPDSIKGCVNESFDLKFTYLPCPLGTVAGKKYPANTGSGYAYVDTTTQEVVDLVVDNSVSEEQAGQLMEVSSGNVIKVACLFANGGCNFMKVIKV